MDPSELEDSTDSGAQTPNQQQAESAAAAAGQNKEGLQLLANAAKRVWEELYVCKKPVSLKFSFIWDWGGWECGWFWEGEGMGVISVDMIGDVDHYPLFTYTFYLINVLSAN